MSCRGRKYPRCLHRIANEQDYMHKTTHGNKLRNTCVDVSKGWIRINDLLKNYTQKKLLLTSFELMFLNSSRLSDINSLLLRTHATSIVNLPQQGHLTTMLFFSSGRSFLAALAAASAKRTSREMIQICTNPYFSFAERSGRDFNIFRIKVTLLSWHLSMACV